jgi:L-rhamnose mutarotase
MGKYGLTLDLVDNPDLIHEYENLHKNVWKEILDGIKLVGIMDMQIFRWQTRLVMVIEVPENFDFELQMQKLATLPRQQEWEKLMWKYQKELIKGEKWVKMERVFKL